MNAAEIQLQGNRQLLTTTPGEAYRILSGRVLVFILPIKEENQQSRRRFLCELGSGDVIPSLCYDAADIKGQDCKWVFALSALEPGTLQTVEDTVEVRNAFAQKLGLRDYEELGFEESVVENYRLEAMRDQRNLFATSQERKSTYARSLDVIYRLFQTNKFERRRQFHEPSGNTLYDACVRLCDWQGIEPASLDYLRANCGRRFDVKEIARISGFICRDILLEENWYRRDVGAFLAFRNGSRQPVVCLPKKNGVYLMWDPAADTYTLITNTVAAELDPRAVIFYRPFPRESITVKKLMLFALHDLNWRDMRHVLLFALLGTLVGLLIPYLNEKLFDLFIPLGDAPGLRGICAVVLACSLGNITFTVVKDLSSFRALHRIKYAAQILVQGPVFRAGDPQLGNAA